MVSSPTNRYPPVDDSGNSTIAYARHRLKNIQASSQAVHFTSGSKPSGRCWPVNTTWWQAQVKEVYGCSQSVGALWALLASSEHHTWWKTAA